MIVPAGLAAERGASPLRLNKGIITGHREENVAKSVYRISFEKNKIDRRQTAGLLPRGAIVGLKEENGVLMMVL
jgi:hypothetical protein